MSSFRIRWANWSDYSGLFIFRCGKIAFKNIFFAAKREFSAPHHFLMQKRNVRTENKMKKNCLFSACIFRRRAIAIACQFLLCGAQIHFQNAFFMRRKREWVSEGLTAKRHGEPSDDVFYDTFRIVVLSLRWVCNSLSLSLSPSKLTDVWVMRKVAQFRRMNNIWNFFFSTTKKSVLNKTWRECEGKNEARLKAHNEMHVPKAMNILYTANHKLLWNMRRLAILIWVFSLPSFVFACLCALRIRNWLSPNGLSLSLFSSIFFHSLSLLHFLSLSHLLVYLCANVYHEQCVCVPHWNLGQTKRKIAFLYVSLRKCFAASH